MSQTYKHLSTFMIIASISGCLFIPETRMAEEPTPLPAQQFENAEGEVAISDRGIETIQTSHGVFVYRYAETMDQIDPLRDYEEKRKVTNGELAQELKELMMENRNYTPEFRARCLPVWDYGIEFRESAEQRATFLFSFRCNTIKYVEEDLYKDFSPQSVKLYSIFEYEIDDDTSRVMR